MQFTFLLGWQLTEKPSLFAYLLFLPRVKGATQLPVYALISCMVLQSSSLDLLHLCSGTVNLLPYTTIISSIFNNFNGSVKTLPSVLSCSWLVAFQQLPSSI